MRREANGEKRGKCLGERRMVGREVNGLMQIFPNRNRFICDKERVVVRSIITKYVNYVYMLPFYMTASQITLYKGPHVHFINRS